MKALIAKGFENEYHVDFRGNTTYLAVATFFRSRTGVLHLSSVTIDPAGEIVSVGYCSGKRVTGGLVSVGSAKYMDRCPKCSADRELVEIELEPKTAPEGFDFRWTYKGELQEINESAYSSGRDYVSADGRERMLGMKWIAEDPDRVADLTRGYEAETTSEEPAGEPAPADDRAAEITAVLEILESKFAEAVAAWRAVADDHRAPAARKTAAYEDVRTVLLKLSAMLHGSHTVSYARDVSSRISAPARREISTAIGQAERILALPTTALVSDVIESEELLAGVNNEADAEEYLRKCHRYRVTILAWAAGKRLRMRDVQLAEAIGVDPITGEIPAETPEPSPTDDLADAARELGIELEIRDVSAELVAAGYTPAAAEIKKHAAATTRVELTREQAERLARIVNAGGSVNVLEPAGDGAALVAVKGHAGEEPREIALTAAGEILELDPDPDDDPELLAAKIDALRGEHATLSGAHNAAERLAELTGAPAYIYRIPDPTPEIRGQRAAGARYMVTSAGTVGDRDLAWIAEPEHAGELAAAERPRRLCAGSYAYRGWIVNRVRELGGEWVAYREDDPSWILDPIPTLRETIAAIDARPDPAAAARAEAAGQGERCPRCNAPAAELVEFLERPLCRTCRGWMLWIRLARSEQTPARLAELQADGDAEALELRERAARIRAGHPGRVVACAAGDGDASISVPIEPEDDPDPDPHGAPIASVIASSWDPTHSRRRAKGAGRPEWRPLNAAEYEREADGADLCAFRGSYVLLVSAGSGLVVKTRADSSPLRVLDVRLTPELLEAFGVEYDPATDPNRAERWAWSDGDYTITLPNGETLEGESMARKTPPPVSAEELRDIAEILADVDHHAAADELRALAAWFDGERLEPAELVPAASAARRLGVTRRTVQDWARAGKIPGAVQTPGGHWRVPRSWSPGRP